MFSLWLKSFLWSFVLDLIPFSFYFYVSAPCKCPGMGILTVLLWIFKFHIWLIWMYASEQMHHICQIQEGKYFSIFIPANFTNLECWLSEHTGWFLRHIQPVWDLLVHVQCLGNFPKLFGKMPKYPRIFFNTYLIWLMLH